MVATSSSMEFRLAAASGCKLQSRILNDTNLHQALLLPLAVLDSRCRIFVSNQYQRLQLHEGWHVFCQQKKSQTATSLGKTHFCVIINQSMQFPWRLKNWLMALPISYLSTWVLDNKTTLGWGNRHILAALNFNCWNFQSQNLSTSSQECLFSHQF